MSVRVLQVLFFILIKCGSLCIFMFIRVFLTLSVKFVWPSVHTFSLYIHVVFVCGGKHAYR